MTYPRGTWRTRRTRRSRINYLVDSRSSEDLEDSEDLGGRTCSRTAIYTGPIRLLWMDSGEPGMAPLVDVADGVRTSSWTARKEPPNSLVGCSSGGFAKVIGSGGWTNNVTDRKMGAARRQDSCRAWELGVLEDSSGGNTEDRMDLPELLLVWASGGWEARSIIGDACRLALENGFASRYQDGRSPRRMDRGGHRPGRSLGGILDSGTVLPDGVPWDLPPMTDVSW